jgi:hypothetical protein
MRFFSKEKRNAIFHGHLLLFRSRPSHRLVVQAPPSGFKGGIWLRFRTFSVKFAQKKGIYNELDALSAQNVHIFV